MRRKQYKGVYPCYPTTIKVHPTFRWMEFCPEGMSICVCHNGNRNINSEGLLNLIGAMLRLTSQDIKIGNKSYKEEAIDFLTTQWYEDICEGMSIAKDRMNLWIIRGELASRCSYE